ALSATALQRHGGGSLGGGGGGTATYTCGSGGAYADINGCVAAALADSTVISGGVQQKNIVFQVTSAGITTATTQTISGWTAGSFTTRVQPDSGGGFRTYLLAHTSSPLYFNTTYGGFINLTNPNNDALDINVNNVTVFGIQVQAGDQTTSSIGGLGPMGIYFEAGALVGSTVDSSIVVVNGYPGNNINTDVSTVLGVNTQALTVQNTLMVEASSSMLD